MLKGRIGVLRVGTDSAAGGAVLGDVGAVVAQDVVASGGGWYPL